SAPQIPAKRADVGDRASLGKSDGRVDDFERRIQPGFASVIAVHRHDRVAVGCSEMRGQAGEPDLYSANRKGREDMKDLRRHRSARVYDESIRHEIAAARLG